MLNNNLKINFYFKKSFFIPSNEWFDEPEQFFGHNRTNKQSKNYFKK